MLQKALLKVISYKIQLYYGDLGSKINTNTCQKDVFFNKSIQRFVLSGRNTDVGFKKLTENRIICEV